MRSAFSHLQKLIQRKVRNKKFNPRLELLEDRSLLSLSNLSLTVNPGTIGEGSTATLSGSFADSTTLANSVNDFSLAQGQGNWYYGYYATPGNSSTFTQMQYTTQNVDGFAGPGWQQTLNPPPWTGMWAQGAHPSGPNDGPVYQPARRWQSTASGSLTISGLVGDTGTPGFNVDGITCLIFVNGTEVFSQHVDAGTQQSYSVNVSVTAGQYIDFVIDPGSTDYSDHGLFTAAISEQQLPSSTVAINWGDGSSSSVNLAPGVLTFSATHQYADEQGSPDSIGVTVTDSYGFSTSGSTSVTVNDVPPSNLQLSLSASTLNEGDSTTLSGTFADPGTLDTHTVSINWSDGSSSTLNLAAGVWYFTAPSHEYLDEPSGSSSYAVSVTVADDDGSSTSSSTNVTVNDVAPSNLQLALSASTINEGDATSLSGSLTDAGPADTHTVSINWGDGSSSVVDLGAGVVSFSGISHQYLDDNASGPGYTIQVTVADDDGSSTSASTSVAVNNIPLANLQLALTATTINENGFTTLSGSFSDAAPVDTHTVTIDWGDGTSSTMDLGPGVTTIPGTSHQYLDAASYTIGVTVTDDDPLSISGSIGVTVLDVPPSNVQLALSAASINENGSTNLSGSFSDPGTLDTHTVSINWGDGSTSMLNLGTEVLSFGGISHQYLDEPSGAAAYTITVTVADQNGNSGSGSTTVVVNDVAPSSLQLALSAATIGENSSTTFSGTFADPGTLDTHTVTINWGDGSSSTLSLGAGVLSFGGVSHQYLDEPSSGSTYAIQVTVADDDGSGTSATTSVAVNDVAPSNLQLALSASTILENGSTSLSGTFTDPGSLDTHTVTINWGDGTSSSLSLAAGVQSFSGLSHQYLDEPGNGSSYAISVAVTDDDGSSTSAGTSVTVNNVTPSNLQLFLSATAVTENGSTILGGAFTDPATLDTHTVSINWGDGSTSTVNLAAGVVNLGSLSHQYLNEPSNGSGSYTITVTVADDDGASTSASIGVTILNAPLSNLQLALSATTVNAGDPVTLSGSFSDPGTLDTHTVVVNWGDGASSTVNLGPGVLTFGGISHAYHPASSSAGYVIQVTVTDEDPDSISGTLDVHVNSGQSGLSATLTGPTDGVRGQDRNFTLGVAGAASGARFTYYIDWDGDGKTDQVVTGPSGLQIRHDFSKAGTYTVSVRVRDSQGDLIAPASWTITIKAAELQADPFSPNLTDLVVGGTQGNDVILFSPGHRKNQIDVYLDGQNLGPFTVTGRIVAYAQGGNDLIWVSPHVKVSAWLFAGSGNDVLAGGDGNDVLVGGSGNDLLVAGSGRDLLIGGSGRATLVAGSGEDIVIGGTTSFDHNQAALYAIMQEWTSRDDRATRIADLGGTGHGKKFAHRQNGNYFLREGGPDATVFDDHSHDVIFASWHKDWIFADHDDKVHPGKRR
jgi:hypothetical protein